MITFTKKTMFMAVFMISFISYAQKLELPKVRADLVFNLSANDYARGFQNSNEQWAAIKSDLDTFYFKLSSEISKTKGNTVDSSKFEWVGAFFQKIREQAEKLYALNPKGMAENGILGSALVGEFFYRDSPSIITGDIVDTSGLKKAEKLLANAKKKFPAALTHLGLAYAFQRKFNEAFSALKSAVEQDPGNSHAAESLVGLFAIQRPSLSESAAVKLAFDTANILSKRFGKTTKITAKDYFFTAKLYNEAGKIDEAIRYLKEGSIIFPDDPLLSEALKAI